MTSDYRWIRAHLSQLGTTQLHLRNPWVIAFFSFSFPGFGNLMLHRYAKAFILIMWEFFINTNARINLGIMYSLQGKFEQAKEVLDERWLILYVSIYLYAIWDSYRSTLDLNKLTLLAERENAPLQTIKMGPWDINYLDKRHPWIAVAWSILAPGLGHLYIHKVLTGFFIFAFTVLVMYYSHIPQSLIFTLTGDFAHAKQIIDMQWALYMPSVYTFIFYDAYVSTIEYNKLFEKEQAIFLQKNYQNPHFEMPI